MQLDVCVRALVKHMPVQLSLLLLMLIMLLILLLMLLLFTLLLQLVTRYQAQLQLPIAIVRPSLTCAIAGEPYPGYIGNWAGPIGAAAAMAIGMFDSVSSIASQPTGVWDIVPADMVASSILAAAAAVSAGAAVAVSRMTQSGTIKGSSAERRVVMGYPHPLSAASQLAAVVPQQLGATAGLRFRTADLTAKIQVVRTSASAASYKPRHGDDDAPSSADTHADQDQHFIRQGPTHALLDVDEEDSSSSSPKLLARAGDDRRSRSSTDDSGSNSGSSSSRSGSSRSSVADGPVSSVDDGAQHHHGYESGRIPLLVVHAASSSTYPLVLMEGWNLMLDFLDAHPPPFRCELVHQQAPTALPRCVCVCVCLWLQTISMCSKAHSMLPGGDHRTQRKAARLSVLLLAPAGRWHCCFPSLSCPSAQCLHGGDAP